MEQRTSPGSLPLTPYSPLPAPHSKREQQPAKREYRWPGKKILLVEDDEANMLCLQVLLDQTQTEIVTAVNGKGVRAYYGFLDSFDLILLDVRLPDASGWNLAREIKAIRPEIAVIAQTAFAMSADRQKSIKAGCDDYISKPIRGAHLLEMLAKYLGP
ncbi:MAG: response regulator [Bacteroidota bacterium]